MSYHETVSALGGNPEQMEAAYQAALRAGEVDDFKAAIDAAQTYAPDNVLYAAWYYRLRSAAVEVKESFVNWAWAVPLAVLNGLIFWGLSDDTRFVTRIQGIRTTHSFEYIPYLFVLAGPIVAAFVLTYLTGAGRRNRLAAVVIGVVLLLAGLYALWVYPRLGIRPFQEQYLTLGAFHLPLLAWAGVGIFLLAGRRDASSTFAFLYKSLEVFIMGGLFILAGVLFTAITMALFAALNVELPAVVQRLFIAGGAGLIPVIAVAVVYNPFVAPREQSFTEGLSRLPALLARVLLPLTILVLLVYLAFIPFNFRAPFNNREVLITFNLMLFAVVLLLVGATPVDPADVTPRMSVWLRRGIIAVAALAALIGVYALAAIVYRSAMDRLTPNRLAFIGWNVINIGLLLLVLLLQVRARGGQWLPRLHQAVAAGAVAYTIWTAVIIFAVPWLLAVDRSTLSSLPPQVQDVVFRYADPVLLKCSPSPHIYLLEDGRKRWIDTIATFEARGYVWDDVHLVTCDNLRAVPDGVPIPADAGPPPQP